jgi:tetratricopeptide (TPR) repeat protein
LDLLDFPGQDLYFDTPLPVAVAALLEGAADQYGSDGGASAEAALLRAYFLAPEHLSVLVALYRYYYYQHRLEDALLVAERAIALSARDLALNQGWQGLDEAELRQIGQRSMTLTRFLLLALKGAGYLELRLKRAQAALARFEKLAALDSDGRLGIDSLLRMARTLVTEARIENAGDNLHALRRQ